MATSYVEYRTLQRRITLAQSNIAKQEGSVGLTRDRETAGLAPKIDVTQAETNLSTSRALIPQLQTQAAATRNRLSVLVGRYPGSIASMLGNGDCSLHRRPHCRPRGRPHLTDRHPAGDLSRAAFAQRGRLHR